MGLDTTHGCWHGSYTAFGRWREKLAEVAGLPPLELMDGFYVPLGSWMPATLYHGDQNQQSYGLKRLDKMLPIKWDCLKPDPIHKLLHHSDCDGEIAWEDCVAIAERLEQLIPLLQTGGIDSWGPATQTFADGLRLAAKMKENLGFY